MDGIGEINLNRNINQYSNKSQNSNVDLNPDDSNVSKSNTESGLLKTFDELKRMAEDSSKAEENAALDNSKKLLESLVKQCEMMRSNIYTPGSWNSLMSVYGKVKKLAMNSNPKLKDLKKAISEISAAFGSLKRAEIKAKDKENEKERKQGLPIVLKTDSDEAQPVNISTGVDNTASVSASPANVATAAVSTPGAGLDLSV